MKTSYDYIVAGLGCAGMSLLVHMLESEHFKGKRILAIDKSAKTRNDRTWCFWEKQPGIFEKIVFKRWSNLWVKGKGVARLLQLDPYEYKMIRGIDFYRECMQRINESPNIEVKYTPVSDIQSDGERASLLVEGHTITADFIFSSIPNAVTNYSADHYLLQHFMGWTVQSDRDVFDPSVATLMDFDISQNNGNCFVYVMPFSKRTALVEYTVFSKQTLTDEQYTAELKAYLKSRFDGTAFIIMEVETGVIPMTSYRYKLRDRHIVYIGSAGGRTKPSSGYTFRFIQQQSAQIVNQLVNTGNYIPAVKGRKFDVYDRILLNVLVNERVSGAKLFGSFFNGKQAADVFDFLDEESNIHQDFKIMSRLPWIPFAKAGLEEILFSSGIKQTR